jgi:predicted phage terminase large subunit-like protein
MTYTFQLVSSDGEILETFETAEQRWATGDTVIAHGNRRYRVVSVIPVERLSEFVDDPAGACSRSSRSERGPALRPAQDVVADVVRARKAAGAVEQLVRETAERDGREVAIVIEQDGGGAGKALASRYTRDILRGFNVRAYRPTGSKELRARPVAAASENGYVWFVRGRHTDALLDECSSFPHGRHDDCVDALAGAHQHVSKLPRSGTRTTSVPRRRPGINGQLRRYHYETRHSGHDAVEQLASSLGARIYDTRSGRPRRV